MANTDYVVRLTGKDDLSKTIHSVKTELKDVGKAATSINKIDAQFDRITKSSAPLKRQLRDLQALMAKMNFEGLSNTDQFTKIAQEAGRIKDAIADAATATQKFSSDTMKLDAAIQGIQGIAAATSIATGAMALFGNENKEVQQAILKVQSALSILNGVQALANTLNKDSALMQRVKQIRMAATTQTTITDTVATVANTTATAANTVATTTNTAANKAWNITKAVGKALLGDWTGLLLVGVTSLAAYSIATSKSKESQEELTEATKEGAEAQSTYTNTLSNTYANLMTKYIQLANEWKALSNEHAKAKWIIDNKSKLDELDISVSNVYEAEKVFNGNTNAVVQSFIKRAKAAARLAELTELYRKQMQLIDQRGEALKDIGTVKFNADKITKLDDELRDVNKQINNVVTAIGNEVANTKTNTNRVNTTKVRTPKIKTTPKPQKKVQLNAPANIGEVSTAFEVPVRINPQDSKKVQEQFRKLQEDYTNLQRNQSFSTFDIFIGGNNDVISEIENQMNFNDNLISQLREIKDEYDKLGLSGTEAYKTVSDEIMNLTSKQIDLGSTAQGIIKQKQVLEDSATAWGYYGDMLNGVTNAMGVLGGSTEAMMAQFAVNTASIIANAVSTITAMNAEAMAKGASSAFSLPFPANLAAWATVAATITSIFASLPKFAEGGIIGGTSSYGDKVLARVNSGEMILNKRQQSNLFDVLDSGISGSNSTISFKIKGSDLYGTLRNYSKTAAKTGKITGIQ